MIVVASVYAPVSAFAVVNPAADVQSLVKSRVGDEVCHVGRSVGCSRCSKCIQLLFGNEHPLVRLDFLGVHVSVYHVVRISVIVVIAVLALCIDTSAPTEEVRLAFLIEVLAVETCNVEHVGLALYRNELPCVVSVAVHITAPVEEVIGAESSVRTERLYAVAALDDCSASGLTGLAVGLDTGCVHQFHSV